MAKKVVKQQKAAEVKVKAVKSSTDDVKQGIGCAILSYILIGIVWFFVDEKMRNNNFAKFHVKQALVLLIASIIVSIILSIIGFILLWIPVIGWILMAVLWWVFSLGIFILWLMGIIYSATGKKTPLPIIGGFADKMML